MSEFVTPDVKRTRSSLKIDRETESSPKFVIPPSPFLKQLGYGTGVNVYLLERFSPLKDSYNSPWAVKKINRKTEFTEFSKRLSYEADILKSLKHPNIIGYRSYGKGKDGMPCLMMESGEKSLLSIIECHCENELGPLPAANILKVCSDVASALQYLHVTKRLLHGDIKSANVLIMGDFKTVKLCDFGVAVKLTEKGEACNDEDYVGTECWSASEVFTGDKITTKTDMFAFGLIIWEMIALSPPHVGKLNFEEDLDEQASQEDIEIWEAKQAKCDAEYFKSLGSRPQIPLSELDEEYLPVMEIFYACTESDPNLRPSAKQIVHSLNCLDEIHKSIGVKDEKEREVGEDKGATPI
ncbi:hypothetical protein SK128_028251 [Halocaridina rubra]|uniref:Protein kinase domain-containing protein n=1 Tax=Halocaridina rubra TaxID=373956 RepID=A0AAN8XNH1_HALRR